MAMNKKNTQKSSEGIRLNKFIAHAGICSRREADMYIKLGSVKVNNKVMTEMGYKVKPTWQVANSMMHTDLNIFITMETG